MAEKVVGLRGAIVPQAMPPNADVIKLLEDTLERARSGNVLGVSLVMQYSDECCQWQRAGLCSYRLLGFATGMVAQMADQLSKDL
jgi:hypothetical protein